MFYFITHLVLLTQPMLIHQLLCRPHWHWQEREGVNRMIPDMLSSIMSVHGDITSRWHGRIVINFGDDNEVHTIT